MLTEIHQLTTTYCNSCGITFAVPIPWLAERRRNGHTFYCPNGCSRVFRETEADKLRKQLERERQRVTHERDQREATERSLRATKGVLTRTKKRIAAGVCPECHRSFQNVRRHMETKHPHLAEAQEANA